MPDKTRLINEIHDALGSEGDRDLAARVYDALDAAGRIYSTGQLGLAIRPGLPLLDVAAAVLNLAKLPPLAFLPNTRNHSGPRGIPPVIGIVQGEDGYHPVYTGQTAQQLNDERGVTTRQAHAMYHGSLFGWYTSGADPDNPINDRPLDA